MQSLAHYWTSPEAQSREHHLVILVLLAAFVAVYLLLVEVYNIIMRGTYIKVHNLIGHYYYEYTPKKYHFDKEKLLQH
jgi:hypothetical protein